LSSSFHLPFKKVCGMVPILTLKSGLQEAAMIRFFKRKLTPNRINADVGLATHTGMVRSINEDSITCTDLPKVYIAVKICAVADGLGGYEGGEIASKAALEAFVRSVTESVNKQDKDAKKRDSDFITNMLIEAVKVANTEVYVQAQSGNRRMATTLAAVLILDTKAYVVNVGDSRVYSLDGDNLRRITADHSLVAELVASGTITPDEIYTHPQRNMITRCLGVQSDVQSDTFIEDFKPGNSLMICSDGLWEMVRDNQIKEIILRSSSAQSACDSLVEEANKNGGVDNISVIIVKAK
jgi:serine/threonine protein phosphatase PrpC